jgi:hypothetical protein
MVLLDAHRETTTHVSEPDWNAFVGELTLLCDRIASRWNLTTVVQTTV